MLFKLLIRWSDGHLSPYDVGWLQERAFCPERQRERTERLHCRSAPQPFTAKEPISRYGFDEIMQSDEGALAWLQGETHKCG